MEITEEKMSDESLRLGSNLRWNVNRRSRRVAAPHFHIHIGDSASSIEAMEKKLTSTPPGYAVMKYMVPTVLALVTLKYQDKRENLFVENTASLWCFLVATFVYWVIVGRMKQISTINTILSCAALASGVLSTLSLVSIILPTRISFVPLIIWALVLVVLVRPIVYTAYTWLRSRIASVCISICSRIRRGNVQGEGCLPV